MKKHWLYLKYVLRHKYFVFRYGRKMKVSLWQLLVHDLSKFSPVEWRPYVEYFYGDTTDNDERTEWKRLFKLAWEIHWHRNPHHWNHWSTMYYRHKGSILDENGELVEPEGPFYNNRVMPDKYILEMIADWMAAGMAQNLPDVYAWYDKHEEAIHFHPETRIRVELLLNETKEWYEPNTGAIRKVVR